MKTFSYTYLIKKKIIDLTSKDKNLSIFCEGINDKNAMFGSLPSKKERKSKNFYEMPLSENLILGTAIGASMLGERVLVNFQRTEFSLLALEQIINNAAKIPFMSNGRHRISLVIRMVIGRGWGQGPMHSQSFESLFSSIPGLRVYTPTFPEETAALLESAIKINKPVIFLENRWNFFLESKKNNFYKISNYLKISTGFHLTLLTNSYNTVIFLAVNKIFRKYGISIDHFHLSIIKPLNINFLKKSLIKTKKFIIIDSSHISFGFNAEVIASITSDFNIKNVDIIRMGNYEFPLASSRGLNSDIYPNPLSYLEKVDKLLKFKKSLYNKLYLEISEIAQKENDRPIKEFNGPF
jgi:pyruvate/2-oxoglutarate/acetoin dehydrogenase E1 component